MANHIQHLLNTWYPQRDEYEWVLATIIDTQGSSYRKSGAMMLINSLGQHFGLLSGGCLESDIMRQARRCWDTKQNRIIEYDMREEEDLAYRLGLGCGGLVRIILQPVDSANNNLDLHIMRECFLSRQACIYSQHLTEGEPKNRARVFSSLSTNSIEQTSKPANTSQDNQIKHHFFKALPHIAIFGAGIDAIPLLNIAQQIGWEVSIIDSRASHANRPALQSAQQIIKTPLSDTQQHLQASYLHRIDAAVIMTHNVEMDAQALHLCQSSSASYVGLLGPIHRTDKVLACLKTDAVETPKDPRTVLKKPLANPIGLQLGGELPESIALSIVAEIHAFFEQADASSISGLLNKNALTSLSRFSAVSPDIEAVER